MTEYLIIALFVALIPIVLHASPFLDVHLTNHKEIPTSSYNTRFIIDEYILYLIFTGKLRNLPNGEHITVYIFPPESFRTKMFIIQYIGMPTKKVIKEMGERIQFLNIVKSDIAMREKVKMTPYSFGFVDDLILYNDGDEVNEIRFIPIILSEGKVIQ